MSLLGFVVGLVGGLGAFVFRELNQAQRITLITAGAGAGIAATFNTPIGGVLFAIELVRIVERPAGGPAALRRAIGQQVAIADGAYVRAAHDELCRAALASALRRRRGGQIPAGVARQRRRNSRLCST
jgi:hypothetical protein